MSKSEVNREGADIAAVGQLLDRRNQVQGWLARLDELTDDIADHVASRVRADYADRLESVVTELGTHLDGIRADVDDLRTRLDDAGRRYESAVDSLEESRLRYRIGELQERDWEERRVSLEGDVASMASARDAVAGELHRMEDLVAQIEGGAPPAPSRPPAPEPAAPPPPPPAEPYVYPISEPVVNMVSEREEEFLAEPFSPPAEEPVAEPLPEFVEAPPPPTPLPFLGGRDFPWEIPAPPAPREPEPVADVAPPADFLAELDRALNEDSSEEEGYTLTEAELEGDSRPKPGVKCPDCGYTNDPQAWYCGVCGADLN
jgi:hypothetical protein